MFPRITFAIVTSFAFMAITASADIRIHISSDGKDSQAGTEDAPMATWTAARDKIRGLRQTQPGEEAAIVLTGNIWNCPETLLLEPQDSHLTVEGKLPHPLIWGAPLVTGWSPHEGSIFKADIAALLPLGFLPRQLFCDGERQILARYPNFDPANPLYGGWAFVDAFPPAGAPEGHDWNSTFFATATDIRKWRYPEDVEVDIFAQYGWWNFVLPVQSVDPATKLVTLAKKCDYDLHPANRYRFQNALEELDTPGEWYFDKRSGILYFWPPGEISSHEIRVPVLESFVKVTPGTSHVTIQNLAFIGCHGSAITMDRVENGGVSGCEIRQCGAFGGSGISVNGGKNVRLSHNEIGFTGSNGISLNGGDRKTLTGPGHVAEDNHIHHMGYFNKNACGISMYGVDLTAAHNHIHDGPRMGVQMSGNNLIVEYNHLHHLVLETQDGGAIYTGGRDWISSRGSVWRYNLIHDIIGVGQEQDGLKSPWFSFGLYPDDNSGGIDIIGNVVYRVAYTPLHMHNARDCLVENNIFAYGKRFQFDLHGWTKEMPYWKSHGETMIQGYESVAGQPAWANMRGMNLHPRDAFREDGTMMSGNVVRRNIMLGDTPGVKYGDIRHCSSKYNVIDENVAWNSGHPVITGVNKVGPDKGGPVFAESFDSVADGTLPKGWGFNHRPNQEVKLVVIQGVLQADCAVGQDPGNPKTVFHAPELPFVAGAAYRVRGKIKTNRPTARVDVALAAYEAGQGYWQCKSTTLAVTPDWQDFEVSGRLPQEGSHDWKAWMKTFWPRFDCHDPEGQVFFDEIRVTQAEPLDEWASWQQEGWDKQGIVADPLFVDPVNGDFRLQQGSPALKLGFQPIPFDKIGPRPSGNYTKGQ